MSAACGCDGRTDCLACLRDELEAARQSCAQAIRQRDEARALVAVEARRADAWKAEADRLTGRLEELRAAVCEAYEEHLHRPKLLRLLAVNGAEP